MPGCVRVGHSPGGYESRYGRPVDLARTTLLALLLASCAWAAPATLAAAYPGRSSTPSSVTPATAASTSARATADVLLARREIGRLATVFQHLDDVRVSVGATPDGAQAVAYYSRGSIVISPDHDEPVEVLLAHELWHIVDWRDDGQLDWGENVPPAEASAYLRL